jgi:hypothetical protein
MVKIRTQVVPKGLSQVSGMEEFDITKTYDCVWTKETLPAQSVCMNLTADSCGRYSREAISH